MKMEINTSPLTIDFVTMRKPLPFIEISMPEWYSETVQRTGYWNDRIRLMFFDPSEIYSRISGLIDPYKRLQNNLNTEILFPKNLEGICRCGCGLPAKRDWHSQSCSNFAWRVYSVIAYGTANVKPLMRTYYGDNCQNGCGNNWDDIDHIISIKFGGGGCWLSNFKPLCKPCHKEKTKQEFKWGEYKQS